MQDLFVIIETAWLSPREQTHRPTGCFTRLLLDPGGEEKTWILGGNVRLNSFQPPPSTCGVSADTWWCMFCFTLSSSRTPPRPNPATRAASLGSVSMGPASVIEGGLETSASTARGDSSKWPHALCYMCCPLNVSSVTAHLGSLVSLSHP